MFEFFGLQGRYGDRPYDAVPDGGVFRRAGHRTGRSRERPYMAEINDVRPCRNWNPNMPEHPRRKNIRLPPGLYEKTSQIFSITICTCNRQPLFEDPAWAKAVFDTLSTGSIGRCTTRYAACLMPDHLHLLIAPAAGNLADVLSGWKRYSANRVRRLGLAGKCWQRSFYDHALRTDEDLHAAAEYIVQNPVRAGLVDDWRKYPFAWHRWMEHP
jgi:REP element-mobilizing transposase RayT